MTQRLAVSQDAAGVSTLAAADSAPRYRVQQASGDRFSLVDAASGQCATASGATVAPAACDASSAQQFLFVPADGQGEPPWSRRARTR